MIETACDGVREGFYAPVGIGGNGGGGSEVGEERGTLDDVECVECSRG